MRRLNAPALQTHTDPLPPMEPSKTHLRRHSRRLCIHISSFALVAVLFSLFLLSRYHFSANYGIIIDCGSTGTRIHVFVYRMGRGALPEIDFRRSSAMRLRPGLSSYSQEPEGAGQIIREMVEFGKEKVPRDLWGETEVRLMATAGMRLLGVRSQERILEACRNVLRSSGFRFQDDWAVVIPGSDEGLYAWVAANYALGTLGDDPQKTTGIIELGGASAQVAFVSNDPLPREFSHVLKFGETSYNLYSHSFLQLGQLWLVFDHMDILLPNMHFAKPLRITWVERPLFTPAVAKNVAYESLHKLLSSRDLKSSMKSLLTGIYKDPCTPKGYTYGVGSLKISAGGAHAIGNFSECRSAALMLLLNEKVSKKCPYSNCNLGSAFIPKLHGRFLATENFFHTAKFCGQDWLTLKEKYHNLDEEDLLQYCFSSAYIIALLHDSLGFATEDARIEFTNQVGDVPIDWALGAFIMQRSSDPFTNTNRPNQMNAVFYGDSGLVPLCIISAFLVIAAWSALKWKKTLLKTTIYDLEKGRYIMRHIKR